MGLKVIDIKKPVLALLDDISEEELFEIIFQSYEIRKLIKKEISKKCK